jgi:hypothetical protein
MPNKPPVGSKGVGRTPPPPDWHNWKGDGAPRDTGFGIEPLPDWLLVIWIIVAVVALGLFGVCMGAS